MLRFLIILSTFVLFLRAEELPTSVFKSLDHEITAPWRLSSLNKTKLLELIKPYNAGVIVDSATEKNLLMYLIDNYLEFEEIDNKKLKKLRKWEDDKRVRRCIFIILTVYFGIKSLNVIPLFDNFEFIVKEFFGGCIFFIALYLFYTFYYFPHVHIIERDYEALYAAIEMLMSHSTTYDERTITYIKKIINNYPQSQLNKLFLEKGWIA